MFKDILFFQLNFLFKVWGGAFQTTKTKINYVGSLYGKVFLSVLKSLNLYNVFKIRIGFD